MRTSLLTTAALFGALCAAPALTPALAQTADPAAPAAPETGSATDTPAATGSGTDTSTAPTTPPRHHTHHARAASSSDGQTFAHEPGTGESGPASAKASNISGSDSHSEIAPHLPQPGGGMNAGPRAYLREAEQALARHQTGKAQQALEMAETRLLDRSTLATAAGQPSDDPATQQVGAARRALGAGDMRATREAIAKALASLPENGGSASSLSSTTATTTQASGMATSQPGGAPMGNGTPTGATMAPSGAGPAPGGDTAGARAGGGIAGTGTADSAGGAK